MHTNAFKRLSALLATGALVLFFGRPAAADLPGELELYGTIEAVVTTAPASITVSGVQVAVDATTQVFDQTQAVVPFTDPPFSVGTAVSIEAVTPPGGAPLATKIELESAMMLEDVDLRGAIQSIGTSSFTAVGLVIVVDANTAIVGVSDAPATFADLAVGQIVEIQGNTQADGSLLATRVKIEDATDVNDVDVLGRIDGLGDTFIVEVGRKFDVAWNTDFYGRRDQRISFAELRLRDLADVQGAIGTPGVMGQVSAASPLVAQKVRASVTADPGIHVRGLIRARTATSITVNKVVYLVPLGTLIENRAGKRLRPAALRVGRRVTIEYITIGTDRVAREIVIR